MFHSVLEAVGNTPLILLNRVNEGLRLAVKLEGKNPGGSAKDRAALSMLRDAEARGVLAPGGLIVEPTSGNTGVGLAMAAAVLGYRLVLTMPDTMSPERRALLAAYGAELVLTPGSLGMQGAVDRANALAAEGGGWIAGQFSNPANPKAHEETTGPEIWRDTEGQAAAFIAGVGTGGTLSGVGRYLKGKNPTIRIIGAEPAESPLLTEGRAGSHGIQGIGANFLPENFDPRVVDRVIPVPTAEAKKMTRRLAREEGILAGISSGAAVWAALQAGKEPALQGKLLVALLPDTGERYLSTGVFD